MPKFQIEIIRKLYYVWDRKGHPKSLLDVANELNADYYELIDWIKAENKKAGAPLLDMHIVTAQQCERHYSNSQWLLDFKLIHEVSKTLLALIFGYSTTGTCHKSIQKAPMWRKGVQFYKTDSTIDYEWQPNLVANQINTSSFLLNKVIYEMTTVQGVVPMKMGLAPEKRTIKLYDIIKYYADRYAKLNKISLDDVINMAVTTRMLDLNL